MTLIGHTMVCEQAGPKQLTQQVATMQLLSDGRFTLGLGAGEGDQMELGRPGCLPRAPDHHRRVRRLTGCASCGRQFCCSPWARAGGSRLLVAAER